MCKVQVLK